MDNYELANLIFDTLSDGYDDEELKDETVQALVNEIEESEDNGISLLTVKSALLRLCKRIEELED